MRRIEVKYLVALILLFTAFVLLEIYRPKPIDWTPSLANKDKIPYGTYVLYSFMDEIFPDREIIESRLPAFNFFREDTALQAHYISISQNVPFDGNDLAELLKFVSRGNSAFIAAQHMYKGLPLLDTLHITIGDTMIWNLRDSLVLFTNPQLGDRKYYFPKISHTRFFEPDTLGLFTVLGRNGTGEPNFIRTEYGKGYFYLHLLPLAFSNYYVLNDSTSDYAFKALSYLPPDRQVIWDEYATQGRIGEQSEFRVLMGFPALKWAYYIMIFGLLLYVLIEGKRRQRIIPVVLPLKNTTLEFVDVVSRLYLQKQDHTGIARKKSAFFLEHIRAKYHLPTSNLDEEFIITLSRKSSYPLEKTKFLIWKIIQVQKQTQNADDLKKLNEVMDDFLIRNS